jgi:hypothetical protein
MNGSLLRTGSLKAFQPLGAVGNPVYLAAAQLRAAIRRRLGPGVADTLAIPHRNEDGDTIDWYAPQAGPVIPWSAATSEERARAKEQLLSVRERIDDLGRDMQGEADGERRVFGRLLEHVTAFPNDGHVYLVAGHPVVTFWGFREQDARAGSDPLLNLDAAPVEPPAPEAPGRRFSWWWLLPLLLLLALFSAWLLRGCDETPPPPAALGEAREAAPAEVEPPRPGGEVEPAEEAAGDESEPPAEAPPPDVLIRERTTDVLTRDPAFHDVETVRDGELAVDALTGAAVEGALSTEVEEPIGHAGVESGGTGTETDIEETVSSEQTGALESEASDLSDASTGEVPARDGPGAEETPEEPPRDMSSEASPGEPPPEPETPGDASGPDTTRDPQDGETAPSAPEPPDAGASAGNGAGAQIPEEAPPDAPQRSADGTTMPGDSETSRPAPPLEIPPDALRARSTRFLNGGWRTSSSLQDPRTALPVDMEYRLEDGAGRLDLRRSDGSVCSGEVKAALEDGRLVIRNSRDIVCPDGTNFGRPRLECVPGKDGRADCSGRYETGELFSVDIKKAE